ncbi:hypothetical protein K8352_15995 [Flavobacteriaceae bacterium F89]|uniref:Uncharacterized protein n=1 Tax=Cerina litoralis TaxID=2874477 RepID=A0AAE3EWN9_9FLAO|nr:hypothetical protein [Cerina litoralis]MCG2462263.1 hypothetical protein [Cerina litoralis]
MKKAILVSLLALVLVQCKDKDAKVNLEKGCYSYNSNGNSISFEITETGDAILGNLNYSLSGKDSNSGTFKGDLNGDKLFGTYTFISEGHQSTREVAFLVREDQLIEGYGNLTHEGTTFKNRDDVSYTSTMPLTKGECHNQR